MNHSVGEERREVRRRALQAERPGWSGHREQAGRGENVKQMGNAASSSPQ